MKKYMLNIFILIFILTSSLTLADEDRVSLGYIYNSSKSHTEIVNNTNGNINTVSPTCFDLSLDGHLEINNIFDQEFIDKMHERNILVTPFLSNHWGIKKAQIALANSEVLAKEVVEAIIKYDLDGVNVDLENLLVKDKDKLTNFVKILKGKMPEGKILSVAVAANPNRLTTTWIAAYDYENLARYSDYLVLMAYDEHSAGGAEGPVASIGFVEESIKVILESVSRDKIVLGIPLYGRFWKLGAEGGGEAIIISQVERIAGRYKNVTPIYDFVTGTATLTLDVKENEKKAYVNGRYLEDGTYTIWYENEQSITEKLNLMNEYGLKGAGLWALDNENAEFWNYYEKAFSNDTYESEESIKERAYYEEVQMLMDKVEPIKLEGELIRKDNKAQRADELLVRETRYIDKRKISLNKNDTYNQKILVKEKPFKKQEKITISHITQRTAKK